MVDYIILSLLVLYGIIYFKDNYVVLKTKEWEIIEKVVEQFNSQQEQPNELPGGYGFFREALDEEQEEDE